MSTGHSFVASGNMEIRRSRKETAGPDILPFPCASSLTGMQKYIHLTFQIGFKTEDSIKKIQEAGEAKHGGRINGWNT